MNRATFIVLGCGKAKRELAPGARCSAVDLYTGSLYQARLAYARALGGPDLIVSSFHRAVEPGRQVETYESDLRTLPKRDRESWASVVAQILAARTRPGDRIIALCSGPYLDWRHDHRLAGRVVEVPGAGLPVGKLIGLMRSMAATLTLAHALVDREKNEAESTANSDPDPELSPEDMTPGEELSWWRSRMETVSDADVCEVSGAFLRQLMRSATGIDFLAPGSAASTRAA